jgi:hypothetical protein
VSTDVIAVPLVKVRLSIVALVASNVATDDIPDAILIFDVMRSGNLSSLIVPVVILAPSARFVAVVAVPVRFAVIVPALKLPELLVTTLSPVVSTLEVSRPSSLSAFRLITLLPEATTNGAVPDATVDSNVVAVTIPATIPSAVIVVAEPTTNEVVIATSFGRPIVIVLPEPTVSISLVVPAIVKVSVSRSIESAPPVSP